MKSRTYIWLLIILSASSLLAGGIIYVFLRPGNFVFHRWFHPDGSDRIYDQGFSFAKKISALLPDWVLYSLPNSLWAFAYALLISGIWIGSTSRLRFAWFASIPVLVFGFEACQGIKLLPGTFSSQDLIFGFLGICAGIFSAFGLYKYQNHKSVK